MSTNVIDERIAKIRAQSDEKVAGIHAGVEKLKLAWELTKDGRKNARPDVDGFLSDLRKSYHHINETLDGTRDADPNA